MGLCSSAHLRRQSTSCTGTASALAAADPGKAAGLAFAVLPVSTDSVCDVMHDMQLHALVRWAAGHSWHLY